MKKIIESIKIIFSKEKIRDIWRKIKKAINYRTLAAGLLLVVLGGLSFIFSEAIYRSFLGEVIVFLKSNPERSFLGFMLVVAPGVFLFHWRWTNAKTWAWRKIAFVFLWLTACFVFFEKVGFDLSSYQELVIRNEEQRKFDNTLDSLRRDDRLLSKLSEKKADGFRRETIILKQSFDSLLSVSNAKGQKISSLEAINKNLRVDNHYLDSLNRISKDPIVITKEKIVPVGTKPSLKKGKKKSVARCWAKNRKYISRSLENKVYTRD